jgi:enterochelin esterase-like enzyme
MLAVAQATGDAGTPLEIGRTYRIESRKLSETRVIDVGLPASYQSDSTRRYPLLLVLDGEYEHQIAASIARFYAETGQVPEMIVVGVRNTNRERDMTTPPVAGFQLPPEVREAGGADHFLSFLGAVRRLQTHTMAAGHSAHRDAQPLRFARSAYGVRGSDPRRCVLASRPHVTR